MDKVIVGGLATIPNREVILETVLDSICSQVDVLEISLNGYLEVPKVLSKYSNIISTISSNEMGDANKFLRVENYPNHYYFSFDDDLIYPKDYVKTYIEKIDKHKCLVTSHGSDINKNMSSYYKGRTMKSHCLHDNKKDVFVDVAGSGVSGYHTSFLKLKYDDFKKPNMADIWMSMNAHKQGVKRLAIAHKKGWIKYCLPSEIETIYSTHSKKDKIQTDISNGFNWD